MGTAPDTLTLKRHRDLDGRSSLWVRRILLLALLVVVVLALANTFGQRPSTTRVETPQAIVSVYSPARVRGGLMFTTRFHITAKADLKQATLILDPGWVEGMQVNSITPQPQSESSSDGRIVLNLGPVNAGHSSIVFIEFQVNPTNVAWHRKQDVVLDDGTTRIATLRRTITVYP